jgi:uncharacterized protein YjiK
MGKKKRSPKKEEKEARKAEKAAGKAAKKGQAAEKGRKKAAREARGKEGAGSGVGLRVLFEERTAAREASGVAVHPSGILLVVDDEAGIFAHSRGKGAEEAPIAEISGCEGVALDEAGTTLYVVSEDSRKVTAFAVRAKAGSITLGEPKKRGALPKLGSKSNKGWEGLAVRPGRFEKDKRPRLVAVHEGKPRQVGIFPLDDFDDGEILDLPGEVDGALDDLSDVAVHPKSGHIFLLSDESSALAEVEVMTSRKGRALATVRIERLPIEGGLKPEGICFDATGDLWLVSEEDRMLRRLKV